MQLKKKPLIILHSSLQETCQILFSPFFPHKELPRAGWHGGVKFNAVSIGGIVIEVALDEDDGGALIAGAGGQVAQGADEVGEAAGGGSLRGHIAHQVAVLLDDLALDGFLQRVAGEVGEIVVRQILQLQLVGVPSRPEV